MPRSHRNTSALGAEAEHPNARHYSSLRSGRTLRLPKASVLVHLKLEEPNLPKDKQATEVLDFKVPLWISGVNYHYLVPIMFD